MQLYSIALYLSLAAAGALPVTAAPSNSTKILEPRDIKISCHGSLKCENGWIEDDLKRFRSLGLSLLDDGNEYNGNSKGESGVCVRGCSDEGIIGGTCASKHAIGLFVKGKGCKRSGAEIKELVGKIVDKCYLCGSVRYERKCQVKADYVTGCKTNEENIP